jgi:hypothetical protein
MDYNNRYIYIIMRRSLLFTTMATHQYNTNTSVEESEPRQFHVTEARDPMETNNQNKTSQRTLSELLARSTQPIFSVSAMFRIKAGGGCGACGH